MNNTETQNIPQEPVMIYRVNTGVTNLPFDVESDLDKYSKVYNLIHLESFIVVRLPFVIIKYK